MSYEDFEVRYLSRAESLTRDANDPGMAIRLCKTVYKQLSDEALLNDREVCVALAISYYSMVVAEPICHTAHTAARIYGTMRANDEQNWISFEHCLCKLSPILHRLSFFERLVAALNVLGWKNKVIATFVNDALEGFPNEIHSVQTLSKVEVILTNVRQSFAHQLSLSGDLNSEWLCSLVKQKDDVSTDITTWLDLENLCRTPKERRFSRKKNPQHDKFGKLRDWWDHSKKLIRRELQIKELLTDRQDDA